MQAYGMYQHKTDPLLIYNHSWNFQDKQLGN